MSLLAFFIAAIVLAITPGPGIAYVVARTVAGGRSEGLASCVGTGIGGLLHVLAAAAGLSILVAQSAVAFSIVKYLGAACLVYLGVRMLRRADEAITIGAVQSQGARHALREGVMVEALNVRTALFFLAFLPQFTSSSSPLAPQLVVLGSICVALNTLVDVAAVFAAIRLLQPVLDAYAKRLATDAVAVVQRRQGARVEEGIRQARQLEARRLHAMAQLRAGHRFAQAADHRMVLGDDHPPVFVAHGLHDRRLVQRLGRRAVQDRHTHIVLGQVGRDLQRASSGCRWRSPARRHLRAASPSLVMPPAAPISNCSAMPIW